MKAARPAIERAVDRPDPSHRFLLLHGPDDAGSRMLAGRLAKAMGTEAERIDLTGAVLKGDPARLADEAAAMSLFGGARHIRVDPAGDDALDAVRALLEAPGAVNPVVLIAGALRKDSKLLKLATDHPAALAFASYPPEGAEGERVAIEAARLVGLDLPADLARRLVDAADGDRMVLASEVEKLALFLDATPSSRQPVPHDAFDLLVAGTGESGDIGELVNAVLSGRADLAAGAIAALAQSGTSGVTVLRAVERRLLLLAELRADVDRGNSVESAVASKGGAIFWKDKAAVGSQLARWSGGGIATALARAAAATRTAMRGSGPGALAIDAELLEIARYAARRR